MISQDDGADIFVNAIPIAGELKEKGGDHIDSKWTRLKTSDSSTDSEKEGLRLTINGGFRKDAESGKTKSQKANIEFLCDKDLEGDENLWNPEDQYDDKFKRQEAGNSSLTFLKYDQNNADVDVLHLEWKTKYACFHHPVLCSALFGSNLSEDMVRLELCLHEVAGPTLALHIVCN